MWKFIGLFNCSARGYFDSTLFWAIFAYKYQSPSRSSHFIHVSGIVLASVDSAHLCIEARMKMNVECEGGEKRNRSPGVIRNEQWIQTDRFTMALKMKSWKHNITHAG